MIRSAALGIVFLFLPCVCFAVATEDSAREALSGWAEAFNSNDAENLLKYYSNSGETDVVVSSGTMFRGLESFEAVVRDDFQFVFFSESTVEDVHERQLSDDVSVFTFDHHFKVRIREDDSRLRAHVQTTMVMQRIDGQWLVVSEHSSALPDVERMVPLDAAGHELGGEVSDDSETDDSEHDDSEHGDTEHGDTEHGDTEHGEDGRVSQDNSIDYLELPMNDPQATKDFYSTHFGWEFEDWGEDYISFSGAGVSGGFNAALEVAARDSGVKVVLYSADLDSKLEELTSAGCTISREIISFPGGRRFELLDPNGNEIAIWTVSGD